MIKICNKCGIEKEKKYFFKENFSSTDGYRTICKKCDKERMERYFKTKEGLITRIYGSQKNNSKKRNHPMPTYCKEWLLNFLLLNQEFHRIYDTWVISGYKKSLTPSIDRIDDYIGYTEYNIKITTWGENEARGNKDRVNGVNNKNSKGVTQYSKDGIFINSYFSAVEASRQTGIDNSDIIKVCKLKNKSAGGFVWRYSIGEYND